jgi:NAD(P)-dependent dehydrogenase (short-subunit alcohol dehydrogenase family)
VGLAVKKTVIITGGVSGIGWGISKKFADQGYNLVLFAAEAVEEIGDALTYLNERNVPYIYVQGDLAKLEDHGRLLEAATERFGRIDVLVNNAGVTTLCSQDILLLPAENFDYVLNINLRGTFFLSQKIALHMTKQEEIDGYRGIIVTTESSNSEIVSIQRGEYCMSKAALSMMTQLLTARLGRESIFVYGIRPGIIATPMTYKAKEKYDAVTSSDELIIKRWGYPEDCAEAVWALCGNDLRYCTGTVISVDGGLIQRRL